MIAWQSISVSRGYGRSDFPRQKTAIHWVFDMKVFVLSWAWRVDVDYWRHKKQWLRAGGCLLSPGLYLPSNLAPHTIGVAIQCNVRVNRVWPALDRFPASLESGLVKLTNGSVRVRKKNEKKLTPSKMDFCHKLSPLDWIMVIWAIFGLQKPNLPISTWDYFWPWDVFFWT